MKFAVIYGLLFIILIFVKAHGGFFIVSSDSMSPSFKAGDIVMVWKKKNYEVGSIVVFHSEKGRYVMHRIIKTKNGRFTTKGDRNDREDLYEPTQSEIIGKVIGRIPTSFFILALQLRTI